MFAMNLSQITVQEDINLADPGIGLEAAPTNWGNLLTLTRQGQSTKWRVWLYHDGHTRLTHLQTPSLPAVDLTFEPNQGHKLRDNLIHVIQRGWV